MLPEGRSSGALVKRVRSKLTRAEFFRKHDMDPSVPLISLLPGSRREEVHFVLPTLVAAAGALGESYQYVVSAAPNIGPHPIRSAIESGQSQGRRLRMAILEEDLYDALCYSE
ncbi:MAG: hypothetical protein E6J89_11300, partial [Deltaproteobacteria bacterium]